MSSIDLDSHPIADSNEFAEQVPVIDISGLVESPTSERARETVGQIAKACTEWGFFQVVNHGVSAQLVNNVWTQMRHFFGLPGEVKSSIMRTKENPWGFFNDELTKNQRDKKEVFDFTHEGIDPIYHSANRWLANEPQFQATMQRYFAECTKLSLRLLEGFCVGLNLPFDYFQVEFENDHTGFVRLNYYPVDDPLQYPTDKQTVADLGVHHHSDAGILTVLLQDSVGGLQVYRDGYWHNITPIEGALVINTGDMMQVWSNDTYQAAIHRVLAMDRKDRYSVPFFFNPPAQTEVLPLPTTINTTNPQRYSSIKWADYRGQRTDGDFADYGAEVQIAQFRRK